MIVYHKKSASEKNLSNQYSSASFFAQCKIFLWNDFLSSKLLRCSDQSALSSPAGSSGYFLTIRLFCCSAYILYLLFLSFIPLFSVILTALKKKKKNCRKHFQDLFKMKTGRINVLYVQEKNMNLQNFTVLP